jgi:hypothetical protein
VSDRLDTQHYLGSRGARGVATIEYPEQTIVLGYPSSRRLPHHWVELTRWCIDRGHANAGSARWRELRRQILDELPWCTTVVSYSDPSVGHSGALYRACNWLWAPTWHVLREPPTGAGLRGGKRQRAKHRWVDPLRPDAARETLLAVRDASLVRRMPWASFKEPRWRGLKRSGGGGDYKRWAAQRA